MPTYRFNPDRNGPGPFAAMFEVYDPLKDKCQYTKITYGQTFITNNYYSDESAKNADLEFISDEPYIGPIVCSYTGKEDNDLEIPDCKNLISIYASLKFDDILQIGFNHCCDVNKQMLVYGTCSGIVLRNMSPQKIRVINTRPYKDNKFPYNITVLAVNNITIT